MSETAASRADRLSSDMALAAIECFFDAHESAEEAATRPMLLAGAIEMASHKLALRAMELMVAVQDGLETGESDEQG